MGSSDVVVCRECGSECVAAVGSCCSEECWMERECGLSVEFTAWCVGVAGGLVDMRPEIA